MRSGCIYFFVFFSPICTQIFDVTCNSLNRVSTDVKFVLGKIELRLVKFEFHFVFRVSWLLSCVRCVLEASSAVIHSRDCDGDVSVSCAGTTRHAQMLREASVGDDHQCSVCQHTWENWDYARGPPVAVNYRPTMYGIVTVSDS